MSRSAGVRLLPVIFFTVLAGLLRMSAWAEGEVVSVDTGGGQGILSSRSGTVDGTGRWVAFSSMAFDLVSNDTNGQRDILLRDRINGITTRINGAMGGGQSNGESDYPSISLDGRYVAYQSAATNLVPNDTNAFSDIFVYDRVANKTTRVSVRSGGGQAEGGNSRFPAISGNGRFVAFYSNATNLVPNDTNGLEDVFVHDLTTKTTTRVSVRSDGSQVATAPLFSTFLSMSRDGRYVAFSSASSDLVAGDVGGYVDIFVHDRTLKTTTLVSRSAGGVQGNASSNTPSISGDGRMIAFESNAGNFSGAGGPVQVYAKNLQTGAVSKVRPAASFSYLPSISADGRRVALVSAIGAASQQVEVVDLLSGQIFQAGRTSAGFDVGSSTYPDLSGDGRLVVFDSLFDGITPGDANGQTDVVARPLFDSFSFAGEAIYVPETQATVGVLVHRSDVLNGAVSVRYSIGATGDTARPGIDYNPALKSGTLSWAANEVGPKVLIIPLINTPQADGYRLFTVALSSATNGSTIKTPTLKVVIKDQESTAVEDQIGHRLQFKKIVSRGTNWDSGLFRALFTVRNPAALPSFPGYLDLRFQGSTVGTVFFDSIPARGERVIDVSVVVSNSPVPTGDLYAILYEQVGGVDVKQDSGLAAGFINNGTSPPSGGTTQPSVGVKTGPPPITVKSITIAGPGTVNEGSFGDYSATAVLSNGTTLNNVTPAWQTSGFSINGAGRLTTGDVAGDKAVTLTARVTHNGITAAKTRTIIVKNVPATPIITSGATAFGTLGKPFSYRITARHEPTQFAAINLPDGLVLNSATGFITGTPTVANTFNATIQASNSIGTDSNPLTITISEPSPLTVNIVGTGTVTPDLNGQLLDVGKSYKLTAKPGLNQLFLGWSGGVMSEAPALTFVMTPNLTVTANFVANPYLSRAGSYVGLIQSNPASHEAGGLFLATVAKSGLCTGKLVIGGKTKPFKTLLKPNGISPTVTLAQPTGIPIVFTLFLDVVGNTGLSGNLTLGAVTASVGAKLKAADTGGLAGKYTALLPGPTMVSAEGDVPDGSGYGIVTVGSKGTVKLVGVLGDGTPFSQSGSINASGQWPVYAPLYSTGGAIFGLANFTAQADSDFNADLSWFKPTRPADAFYPMGWPAGLVQSFKGARYNQPPVFPALGAPNDQGNAIARFSGGGLIGEMTQTLNINPTGNPTRTAPLLPNSGFSLMAASGLVKGMVQDPNAGAVRTFTGVIQQKMSSAQGVFRGGSQRTGKVVIQANP